MNLINFADAVEKAYQTKWSFVNTFAVQFHFQKHTVNTAQWTEEEISNLTFCIKNINTPQFTNSPIEGYVADMWKIHNGRNELFRFNIGFRDYGQMTLYKRFIKTYNSQKLAYFNDCKFSVSLYKDADHVGEIDKLLYTFDDVIIESIGQIQFSNETEAQIAEFEVNFKSINPIIE